MLCIELNKYFTGLNIATNGPAYTNLLGNRRSRDSPFVGSRKLSNSKKFSTKQPRKNDKKVFKIFQANLPLFKGNVLYFLSGVVAESLVV